jgi:hypothetical protein
VIQVEQSKIDTLMLRKEILTAELSRHYDEKKPFTVTENANVAECEMEDTLETNPDTSCMMHW